MWRFIAGTPSYLHHAAAPINSYPCTLAAWIRPVTIGANQTVIHIGDAGTLGNIINVQVDSAGAVWAWGGGFALAISPRKVAANELVHVCGVFTNSALRAIYIDGVLESTDTGFSSSSGGNRTRVGFRTNHTFGFNGQLGEVGIWPRALSAGEVLSLYEGTPSQRIAEVGIYLTLDGPVTAFAVDYSGNDRDFSPISSPTQDIAIHPPIASPWGWDAPTMQVVAPSPLVPHGPFRERVRAVLPGDELVGRVPAQC